MSFDNNNKLEMVMLYFSRLSDLDNIIRKDKENELRNFKRIKSLEEVKHLTFM